MSVPYLKIGNYLKHELLKITYIRTYLTKFYNHKKITLNIAKPFHNSARHSHRIRCLLHFVLIQAKVLSTMHLVFVILRSVSIYLLLMLVLRFFLQPMNGKYPLLNIFCLKSSESYPLSASQILIL